MWHLVLCSKPYVYKLWADDFPSQFLSGKTSMNWEEEKEHIFGDSTHTSLWIIFYPLGTPELNSLLPVKLLMFLLWQQPLNPENNQSFCRGNLMTNFYFLEKK